MGKVETGILGGFSGKVGAVVGSQWRGIDYMRHKGKKSKRPPTAAQLEVQAKFIIATEFISAFAGLFMETFPGNGQKTGTNLALGAFIDNAIVGDYPQLDVDYSKVFISKGSISNVKMPVATAMGNGELRFTWLSNAGRLKAFRYDTVVMVLYCPEDKEADVFKGIATREMEKETISVPFYVGKEVHCWLAMVTKDGKYSESGYAGVVKVS